MVPPIPIEHREEIVKLRDAGYSFRNIRDVLIQKGAKYSVIGIGNCYQKIVKNGSIDAQPKQKYSKEMLERIKQELQSILEENSDLTGQQQIDEIKRRLGVSVSMDAVGRYRRMLGWKVMPIASNKSAGSSTVPSSSSASSSNSSTFNSEVNGAINVKVDIDNADSSVEHNGVNSTTKNHRDPLPTTTVVARTSGYYLHPPDVILPSSIELSVASSSDSSTPNSSHVVSAYTSSSQVESSTPVAATSIALGLQIKDEYGHASTSLSDTLTTISPQMQHQQIHLINSAQVSPSDSTNASNGGTNGTPLNTAIVYPLKSSTARFGPVHVFTSRAIIKTGNGASCLKYQVWAGISYQGTRLYASRDESNKSMCLGATSICIWDANCRMRSSFYCNTILEKFFLPFRAERYPNKRCVIVQSNDTIYRSIETKTYMEQHGINYETWTNSRFGDESNPIELIWDEINDHIRSEIKPQCLDSLREAICNFWATKMTDSKCRQCLKKCSNFSEY